MVGEQAIQPRTERSVSQRVDPQHRNQHADGEQSDPVDGIRDGDRLEAAEDGIDRACDADHDHRCHQRREVGETGQRGHCEELHDGDGTGVEHAGNRHQAITEHEEHDRHSAHRGVEPVVQEFGQGRESAGQVPWQEQECHGNRGDRSRNLPGHAR